MKSEMYTFLLVCIIAVVLIVIFILGYQENQQGIHCQREDEMGFNPHHNTRRRCSHRNSYHEIWDSEVDDVVYMYDDRSFHNRDAYEQQIPLLWNDDEPTLSCNEYPEPQRTGYNTDHRNSTSRNYADSCEYIMDDELSSKIDRRTMDFYVRKEKEAANSSMEGRIRHRSLNDFRVHIPLYIFVIHDNGKGFLSKEEIRSIHNIANEELNKHGFYFSLRKVYYVEDTRWFYSRPNDKQEIEMKEHLHEGEGTTLNIYVKRNEGSAAYPWNFPCYPKLDGISISYMRIPGGEDPDFNEGKTIIHQIGHWLGLKHVFGWSCVPGQGEDGVFDTNQQRYPSQGCPLIQDTCPGQDGPDNFRNFMDYSNDECRVEFTRGQERRMHEYWKVRVNPDEWFASFDDAPCRTRDRVPLTGLAGFNKSIAVYQKTVSCFSPLVTVVAEGRGSMMMKYLKYGDKVLTASGKYQKVFTMDHFNLTKPTRFLQIHSEIFVDNSGGNHDNENVDIKSDTAFKDKQKPRQLKPSASSSSPPLPLEITATHMVFVSGISKPIPASNIRVGDSIQTLNGPRKVTNITTIIRNGLYNPITADGTIVVGDGGVVASAYSSYTGTPYYESNGYKLISAHTVAEWAYAPYRVLCTKIVSLHMCNQHSELAVWNKFMHSIFESYWLYQHEYNRFIIFVGYISFLGPINLIIRFYAQMMTTTAAIIVFQYFRRWQSRRQRQRRLESSKRTE